jgi:hypothetical protein
MNTEEQTIRIGLLGKTVMLTYPARLAEEFHPFLGLFEASAALTPHEVIHLLESKDGTFELRFRDNRLDELVWPNLLLTVLDLIERIFGNLLTNVVIRAGAVGHNGRSALILGPSGSQKTTLTAWLASRGLEFLADNFVALSSIGEESSTVAPLPLPFMFHPGGYRLISGSGPFREVHTVVAGGRVLVPPAGVREPLPTNSCGLVIVPRYHPGVPLAVEILKPDELRFLLSSTTYADRPRRSADADRIAAFSLAVPALALHYGSYDQLEEVDELVRSILAMDGQISQVWSFVERWARQESPGEGEGTSSASQKIEQLPVSATLARYRKRLTIGMATYDDYDGVYFTLQSLRLFHPEVADDIEFIVVDNNPDGVCGSHLKALENHLPHYRYIPIRERSGTAVRDYVMAEAASDFVLNLDCHVLVAPGAVSRLIHYFESGPETPDLVQGPLVYDNLRTLSTHMDPVWRGGMYGVWATSEAGRDPEAPPFDIPSQGLGLYACRRTAWPGYNPHFRGFGGEEGYIHEKFRRAGGRTLCLPFLRWVHRFARPLGTPYPNRWDDRVRNYTIGFDELGFSSAAMEAHFRELLGAEADGLLERARSELTAIKQQARAAG